MQRRDAIKLGILATSASLSGCGKRIIGEVDLVVDNQSLSFTQGTLSFNEHGFQTPLSSISSEELGHPWREAVTQAASKKLSQASLQTTCELAFCLMLTPHHPDAQRWAAEAADRLKRSALQADLILAEGLGIYCTAQDDDEHWQWLVDILEQASANESQGWYNFNSSTPTLELAGRSLATEVMPMLRLKWLWRAYMKLAGRDIDAYDKPAQLQIDHLRLKQAVRYEFLNPDEIFWLLLPSGNHLSGFEAFSLFCALRSGLISVSELPTLSPEISVHSIGVASLKQDIRQAEVSLENHYHHALGTSLLRALGRNTELRFEQLALALSLNSAQSGFFGDLQIANTYNSTGSNDWFDGADNTLNSAALLGLLTGEHLTAWN